MFYTAPVATNDHLDLTDNRDNAILLIHLHSMMSHREKTGFLPMRKQRRGSASQ